MKLILLMTILFISIGLVEKSDAFSRRLTVSDYDGDGDIDKKDQKHFQELQAEQEASGSGSGSGIDLDTFDAPTYGPCKTSCSGGGAIQIDVTGKCMCITGSKCFRIDTGRADLGGPMMTTEGSGIMGKANSPGHGKYWTHPGAGNNNSYDNDAISFGYEAQSGVGKWIHKSRGCGPGGNSNTIGCIGVPCKYWTEVKSHMGDRVTVCRANSIMTSLYGERGAPTATKYKGVPGPMGHPKRKKGGR